MENTHVRQTRRSGLTRRLAAVGVSALLVCLAGATPALALPAPTGLASDQDSLRSYVHGVLTADPARQLEIDNRRFALHPEAMVMDNEGKVRTVEDLREGALVKFHVRQRKIDVLIWMLPE